MIWAILAGLAAVSLALLLIPLLCAQRRAPAPERRAARFAMIVIGLIVPVGAGLLYLGLGAPHVPDQPYAARLADEDFALQVEGEALSKRLMRAPDAAGFVRLGEIRVALAGGRVTSEAGYAFAKALALDPHRPDARYFAGLALAQGGESDKALLVWQALEKDSPPNAPWLETLRQSIAVLQKQKP